VYFKKNLFVMLIVMMVFSALVYYAEGCSVCTVRNGTDIWPRRSLSDFEDLEDYDVTPKLIVIGG